VGKRKGQVESSLHAAGVAADLAVGSQAQADALEQFVGPGRTPVARNSVERELELQMLAAREEWIERCLLEGSADGLPHLGALLDDVESAHPRRAGGRRQQRGQHVHGRRLPGAVRA
jgi:hypothetical protein